VAEEGEGRGLCDSSLGSAAGIMPLAIHPLTQVKRQDMNRRGSSQRLSFPEKIITTQTQAPWQCKGSLQAGCLGGSN